MKDESKEKRRTSGKRGIGTYTPCSREEQSERKENMKEISA
jgi:hypothetical protein